MTPWNVLLRTTVFALGVLPRTRRQASPGMAAPIGGGPLGTRSSRETSTQGCAHYSSSQPPPSPERSTDASAVTEAPGVAPTTTRTQSSHLARRRCRRTHRHLHQTTPASLLSTMPDMMMTMSVAIPSHPHRSRIATVHLQTVLNQNSACVKPRLLVTVMM